MNSKILNIALAVIVCTCMQAKASLILAVDLGRDGQDVEAGFTGFSTVGDNGTGYASGSQVFSGGTWQLNASSIGNTFTRDYGDIISASPLGDLLQDSFLLNTSLDDQYFDLIFDDLAAGEYQLVTYHHAFRAGGRSALVSGGVEGSALANLGEVTGQSGEDISAPSTLVVDFSIVDANDGYVLRFDPTSTWNRHFDLAGFTLEDTTAAVAAARAAAVPEPTSIAIFALGLMGLASRRFKKQS